MAECFVLFSISNININAIQNIIEVIYVNYSGSSCFPLWPLSNFYINSSVICRFIISEETTFIIFIKFDKLS